MANLEEKEKQIELTLFEDDKLPAYPKFLEEIRRAPSRGFRLTEAQTQIALKMP